MIGCKDCGRALQQTIEKALEGDPREAMVWADKDGEWVCPKTGDEHAASADLTPYEVEFTIVVHVLAEDEDAAYDVAETFASHAAEDLSWNNHDDCVTEITEESF